MKDRRYRTKKSETKTFDHETGEVKEMTVNTVISYPREPDYVKLYVSSLDMLRLPTQMQAVLMELVGGMDYQNRITVSLGVKREICRKLGIYDKKGNFYTKVITNYLYTLCKKDILHRNNSGVYTANPFIFGKGAWQDIHTIRSTWE